MPKSHRLDFFMEPAKSFRVHDKSQILLDLHDMFVSEVKSDPSDVSAREDLVTICQKVPRELKQWVLRTNQISEKPKSYGSLLDGHSRSQPYSSKVIDQIISTALDTLDSKEVFSTALEAWNKNLSAQTLEEIGKGWLRYDMPLGNRFVSFKHQNTTSVELGS